MFANSAAPLALYDPNTTIHVAIVDDDATFASFAAANLGINAPFDVVSMTSGDELLAYGGIDQLDCIILDFQLETENGLQLAERLRQQIPDLPPIIMLTGTGDERCVIKAFRSGFADYIPKRKLDFTHLQHRVNEAVENARRRKQREQKVVRRQKHHAEFSMFDDATSCFSRAYVVKAMERLFALDNGNPFALLLIQLETLDDISQACGLVVGEKARKAFAQRLRENMRATDIVGRFDDDRFLCVLDTDCEAPAIHSLCEMITGRLSGTLNISGVDVQISARIGGVLLPDPAVRIDNVFRLIEARLDEKTADSVSFNCGPLPVTGNDNLTDDDEAVASCRSVGPLHGGGPTNASDSRRHHRQRIFKAATLISRDSTISIACVVRDISESGARLRFDGYFNPPPSIALQIAGENRRRNAELRWQVGHEIGVEFVDE